MSMFEGFSEIEEASYARQSFKGMLHLNILCGMQLISTTLTPFPTYSANSISNRMIKN